MSINSGNLDTLDQALQDIGWYGASSMWGMSDDNYCVSYSVARLEHYDDLNHFVDEVFDFAGLNIPNRPLEIHEVVSLLRLTGRDYLYRIFTSPCSMPSFPPLSSAWSSMVHKVFRNMYLSLAGLALYIRPDGSGHCVNFLYCGLKDTGGHPRFMFKDYQQHPMGADDCWRDVLTAKEIILVFEPARHDPAWKVADPYSGMEIKDARGLREEILRYNGMPHLPDPTQWPPFHN